jgi:hypothetical protein
LAINREKNRIAGLAIDKLTCNLGYPVALMPFNPETD